MTWLWIFFLQAKSLLTAGSQISRCIVFSEAFLKTDFSSRTISWKLDNKNCLRYLSGIFWHIFPSFSSSLCISDQTDTLKLWWSCTQIHTHTCCVGATETAHFCVMLGISMPVPPWSHEASVTVLDAYKADDQPPNL